MLKNLAILFKRLFRLLQKKLKFCYLMVYEILK